jgi:hypothetical protein
MEAVQTGVIRIAGYTKGMRNENGFILSPETSLYKSIGDAVYLFDLQGRMISRHHRLPSVKDRMDYVPQNRRISGWYLMKSASEDKSIVKSVTRVK